MTDLVEIAARAIWLHEQEEKWGKLWMEPDNWRAVQYQDREPFRKIARSVLSALREAGAIREEPDADNARLRALLERAGFQLDLAADDIGEHEFVSRPLEKDCRTLAKEIEEALK